ncbi:hypothetical protein [Arthrobacter sp. SD76]|uniref:hypothetical protein n=1 Tax=Arthrobacter sp. SD76 TaxID=3415007 RepID=UPI003C726965
MFELADWQAGYRVIAVSSRHCSPLELHYSVRNLDRAVLSTEPRDPALARYLQEAEKATGKEMMTCCSQSRRRGDSSSSDAGTKMQKIAAKLVAMLIIGRVTLGYATVARTGQTVEATADQRRLL